uniref:hypothetical protein n=1 Tax=Salmonella sp. TaxID=599 RepID=UPI001CD9D598|nr:hypothetical protein [Salmonella sp.]
MRKSSLVTANGQEAEYSGHSTDFKLRTPGQQFVVSDLILSSVDGIITIDAAFPQERMPDNTPYDFNTLVLVDAEERLLVLCTQQDTPIKVNVTVFPQGQSSKLRLIMGLIKRTT